MRWPRAILLLLAPALVSCARPALPGPDGDREYLRIGELELSAVVERDGADVFSMIEIMNLGERTVRLEYQGACGVALQVHAADRPARAPRWDQERWWRAYPEICQPAPVQMELPPNTLARILAPVAQPTDILGDSLAAGRYATAVRLRLLHPRDTLVVLPAEPLFLDE